MHVVYLYGPPGVGKLTVGTALAALTGFRLVHNHLTVNLATALFPRGSPAWARFLRHDKPTDPRVLEGYDPTATLPVGPHLRLDTTYLAPAEAAARIAAHYRLPVAPRDQTTAGWGT